MKVLISGDRNWTNRELIRVWIAKLQDFGVTEIIEGGASGADTIAREEAEAAGIPVTEMKAQWNKFHKAAGVIRNTAMLKLNPEMVIAFHDDIGSSHGTKHMIKIAKKAGVRTLLVSKDLPDGFLI